MRKHVQVWGVTSLLFTGGLVWPWSAPLAQEIVLIRQFGTTAEDTARRIAVDGMGSVYGAGYTDGALPGQTSAGGTTDAFVRKYDASLTEVWTRQFGTSENDSALGVAVDGTGSVYVAGFTIGVLPGQ